MWVFIWIILSVCILGIFFWTSVILYQQKKAWAAYAKKSGLDYVGGSVMESPTLRGQMNGRLIMLYTDVQNVDDTRGRRRVTVIEISLGKDVPKTSAAIVTKKLGPLIAPLSLDHNYKPEDMTNWSEDYIVKTNDKNVLARYLTEKRLKTIHSLFSMKKSLALYFFDEEDSIFHIETSDPLQDTKHLEKIVKRIVSASDILALTEEEKPQFGRLPAVAPTPTPATETES